jgi:hypothetical protein
MKKEYNETFKKFLTEYNLSDDFSFTVDLPTEVQNLLDDKILVTDLGITLKSINKLHKGENQSIIEDSENHFHVDWYVEPPDNRKAFMLGVKTLKLLADKFEKKNIKGVRFWLSFQTPELGQKEAKENNLHEEGDEYFISDRLSFYTKQEVEEIVTIDKYKECAILIIDI